MSHRGLPLTVHSLLVLVVTCATCAFLHWIDRPIARAQVLDKLSELLNSNQPVQEGTDELPSPVRPTEPKSQPLAPKDLNSTDSESQGNAPRIYLGLEAEQPAEGIGVRVANVTRESPAWKAGFRVEDRILGINGFAIGNMEHMVEQLSKTRPGQSVNFLVNREGRNRELIAVLMNADVADQIQNRPGNLTSATAWLGITAADLSLSFREQFGIGAFRGAAVTQVVTGSPAYQSGIRPGDAIIEIGGRPVETAAELQRWVEQSKPGDQAQVVYFRGAKRQTSKIVLVSDPQSIPPPQAQRPQAFPSVVGSGAVKPITPSAKPPIQPPVDPTLNPTLADAPLELEPGQLGQVAMKPSERELALEAEVEQLRKQLFEAQAKLAETKQQLDNILRALKD